MRFMIVAPPSREKERTIYLIHGAVGKSPSAARRMEWAKASESQVPTPALGLDPAFLHNRAMFETFTYDLPEILPAAARNHWSFMESNSASAIIRAVCPEEWTDIVDVLSTYRLNPSSWLKAGGNRGDIAAQIDAEFGRRGWREARLDLETKGLLISRDGESMGELPPVHQQGYLVDNYKNRIVLDVEWNAKDGNLDRDLASYRSWFEAGIISAGVIITKDRLALLRLARKIWEEFQATFDEKARDPKLPVDLGTSTTTSFDKAQMRVRRGVMGTCPVLIVAATEATWNGRPYE